MKRKDYYRKYKEYLTEKSTEQMGNRKLRKLRDVATINNIKKKDKEWPFWCFL